MQAYVTAEHVKVEQYVIFSWLLWSAELFTVDCVCSLFKRRCTPRFTAV